MAEHVKKLPPDGRGNTEKYPWDRWFDGSIWRLSPGVDFRVSVKSMQSAAINAARKRGVKVAARILDGCLYIQASKGD